MKNKSHYKHFSFDTKKAFALYRLPNEADHFLLSQDAENCSSFDQFEMEQRGFVFHPFEVNTVNPALIIKADQISINATIDFTNDFTKSVSVLNERDCLNLLDDFIDATQTDFRKIICSRIKLQSYPGGNLFPLFLSLKAAYPKAFVYLVNVPNVGCWMGATPETFLSIENGIGTTMALAGTQGDKGIPLEEVEWRAKEIEEQHIVEQYIEHIFEERKIDFQKNGPKTIPAGQVLHLQSTFTFKTANKNLDLINALHPSPAVCGIPKNTSRQFITNHEPHDRSYYCGFLGPMNIEDSTKLYVNLRCMQVMEKQFALYVGGGITAASDAKEEWRETELKAKTLLSVIEKVYFYADAIK